MVPGYWGIRASKVLLTGPQTDGGSKGDFPEDNIELCT